MNPNHGEMAKALGYGGLAPFFLLAAGHTIGFNEAVTESLARLYSLGILLFLCGSWWGIALLRARWQELVISNVLFLSLLAAFYFLPFQGWFICAALGFLALYQLEGRLKAFQRQPAYYRRLRRELSLVAGVCMVPFAVF